MNKNKNINITPSKGISIIIKNEFPSQLPIKPKKKRKYRRINVLPKIRIVTSFLPENPLFSRTIHFSPGIYYARIFGSKVSI